MSKNIEINIGENLLKAIITVVEAVDRENSRCDATKCPGTAVQKAFGIDLTKIHSKELSELRRRIELQHSLNSLVYN